ncbi:hypothetical protein GCM10011352_31630 [Marinobacterium zhoushanense]|uniref:Uncharacterized protein n=1 Tax=Marinobacterium zhoushanense TaxID=1679163 RepID=A0ABQ1KNZ5_9GAMM|nr:hypothetical protein GCM10011352_31630 [Marinobacterium zhoushanense]
MAAAGRDRDLRLQLLEQAHRIPAYILPKPLSTDSGFPPVVANHYIRRGGDYVVATESRICLRVSAVQQNRIAKWAQAIQYNKGVKRIGKRMAVDHAAGS